MGEPSEEEAMAERTDAKDHAVRGEYNFELLERFPAHARATYRHPGRHQAWEQNRTGIETRPSWSGSRIA